MTAVREPIRYLGVAGVAAWFDVQPSTVTAWLNRYPVQSGDDPLGWPAPDALIEPGQGGGAEKGWLPGREGEWRVWEARRPGRGAPGRPRLRQVVAEEKNPA